MSATQGISFLYQFDLGNRDPINPGSKILSVTGTAVGDFDKANLTTESLRHTWRSADVIGWQEIVIEADQVTNIDTFAILGHNFTSAAVIQVQANIANNFIAPPVTVTIPWAKRNAIWTTLFGGAFGYYKVRILDPANPCGYVEIGRIVGGRALILADNEDVTDDISLSSDDKADKMNTEGYFRVSNENVKVQSLGFNFSKFRAIPGQDANFVGIKDMIEIVGTTKPLLVILERGDPAFINAWSQLTKLPTYAFTINRFVSFALSFEEVF